MSFELVFQQALNGLSFGALLFILASGLSLVFGMMDVVNLAHGAFYMLGAYIGLTVVQRTGQFWLGLLLAPLVVGALGLAIEPLLLRRLRGRHLDQVLLTIGISLVIADLIGLVAGREIRSLPFPAGLDDCSRALDWVHDHRDELGITSIVLQGESGGANLVLATTLKAKREGRLEHIDGVYATVPYISGGYGWDRDRKLRELPSMVENDGHFLDCGMMDLLASVYDPTGENAENPLAWPYFATEADVQGLPPHVIAVNELDPLRDEGIAYFRLLQRAGVPVVGRVNLGVTHGADMAFRVAIPEAYQAAVRDIRGFAGSL